MENAITLDDIKKEFEIVKSTCASEEYSDGYNANGYPFRGLVNETLAFSVLQKNDSSLFIDIVELGYIAYALPLKSCWLTGLAIGWFIKEEGKKVYLLNKKGIAKLLKHSSKWSVKEIKEEIRFAKGNNKIFYQDRMGWEKREWGKRFIYRKRLAMRVAPKDVYVLPTLTEKEEPDRRYLELVER